MTAGQTLAQGHNGQNDTQGLVHVAANADLRGNGKDVPEVAELRSKIAELHSTISFLEAELGTCLPSLTHLISCCALSLPALPGCRTRPHADDSHKSFRVFLPTSHAGCEFSDLSPCTHPLYSTRV